MAKLDEVVADKSTYPDEMKISLAEGVEVTLGEVRAGYLKDADYRKKTQGLARDREKLQQERAERESAYMEAEERLMELARGVVQQNPGATPTEVKEELQLHPEARKLMTRIDELGKTVETLQSTLKQRDEASVNAYKANLVRQHQTALAQLKKDDPELDEQELIEFARSNAIPRLDVAYRAMKWPDALAKAKQDGAKEGYDKAKKESPILPVRRTTPVRSKDDKKPKTFTEAADAAIADPEIQKIMAGEGGEQQVLNF